MYISVNIPEKQVKDKKKTKKVVKIVNLHSFTHRFPVRNQNKLIRKWECTYYLFNIDNLVSLALYHTIKTFNDPEEEAY